MEISKLVEEAGKLEEAKAYCFPELADEIAAIKLNFQYLSCVIRVLEDSDEIELAKYSDLSALNESDAKLIFHTCVGQELAWCWSMVNNQGYSDALKFQFQSNVAFELVVMASAIKQLTVN
tara:strand:+ start:1765 stop:2127 length:363 start_codon:yes stop_codon:yes gene_type:complete